ncbi:hypothetical protein PGT21_006975 [Puccinia graminis f. sp. tritici]|uniref:Uncharacterized protein n=1 Tax=Puccinia graminis f. sp. tritici TaxID=56615 RepID=A0A5B0M258_PUCGR|nr:hypothetical protein PGT21_006975 [Puccinia graminis f. sp. tritici]
MGGYPLGYPDIHQDSRGKGASAPESAPAGGYPLALAGIRQRITDICNGLSATISSRECTPSGREESSRPLPWVFCFVDPQGPNPGWFWRIDS